ncbi:hypothetical protein [Bacillus sp. FJAT-50079]|uniref:hypothetical protein n=1 Tax=Bacillus sp. FJAT-50079 TaxID=2833577 RepID=UPI001BC8DCEC|nr:hypothetical protein [Bacillus sp. FJAT-50079]MBS4208567.1 hypothetical protein [Bacillus sp. FJAT-50079]
MWYEEDNVELAQAMDGGRKRRRKELDYEYEDIRGEDEAHWQYRDRMGCGCESERNEHKDHRFECNACLCHQLRKLRPGTELIVAIKGVLIPLPVTFLSLDKKTCCAFFNIFGITAVIDCRDLLAIAFIPADGIPVPLANAMEKMNPLK